MRLIFLLLSFFILTGNAVLSAAVFTNVTAAAGIDHLQHLGNAPGAGLFRTGGAAATDYDNDGWVDIYVTRLNARDLLYKNMRDGTFRDVAVAAGMTSSLPTNGSVWGDIDNDGDKDLYVTSSGGNRFYLYINDGRGRFTEEAMQRDAAVAGVTRFGQGVTLGDYDLDGYLDIHTNDWASDTSVSTSRLLRNMGADNPGHFEDVTEAAGLNLFRPSRFIDGSTDSNSFRYTSTFSDLDFDGWPDLAITGDFTTSQIFWNNRDGTFHDGTLAAGVGTDQDGMGSAIGDFDGDGRLDWFVSALVDVPGGGERHSGNRLFRSNGDRTFSDQTDMANLRDSGWSWGTTFLDADNDRDLDLFVTNGWDTASSDQSHFFQNDGGVFRDVSLESGVIDDGMGRGLLNLDYDNDGDLDVFIVNHGANPILYRNDTTNGYDWLKIKLTGTESNRDGIGVVITVDVDKNIAGDEIVREVQAGTSFLSQSDSTAHIGLGSGHSTIGRVSIRWPSGDVQAFEGILSNRTINILEGGLRGDFNQDQVVDAADYVVWRDQLGATGIGLDADGNQDGSVNLADYEVWKTHFGMYAIPAVLRSIAVPEPSTTVLFLAALAIIALRKSKGPRPTCPRW